MGLSIGYGAGIGYYERDADEEREQDLDCEPLGKDSFDLHHDDQRAAEYYMGEVMAGRELNGIWRGPVEHVLNLQGNVTSWQLHQLYGKHNDPTTKEHLGNHQRNYRPYQERLEERLAKSPFATPAEKRQIALSVKPDTQQNRNFFDLTWSLPKSYSMLYVALTLAGRDAEAEQLIQDFYWSIDQAMTGYAEEAGFSRAGHHGKDVAGRTSGRRVDGHDWLYSYFLHKTSRAGDPQIHVHCLVANKTKCDDGIWRTLDSRGIFRHSRSFGALQERFMAERTHQTLGLMHRARTDGYGWEVDGIEQKLMDDHSSRRRAIEPAIAKRATAWKLAYPNQEPPAHLLDKWSQSATMETRPPKRHDKTFNQYLDYWDTHFEQANARKFADILKDVGMGHERERQTLNDKERVEVLQLAVARVAEKKATWSRPDLRAAISDLLPPHMDLGAAKDAIPFLDKLVDEAVTSRDVVTVHRPAAVITPDCLRFSNGKSVYEPFHVEKWGTRTQYDIESRLAAAMHDVSGHRMPSGLANQLIASIDDGGKKPFEDQALVIHTVATSGRRCTVVEAAGGTGKTWTMGQLARIWTQGGGRVKGFSNNQDAVSVLKEAGIKTAFNNQRFLDAHAALERNPEDCTTAKERAWLKASQKTIRERYGIGEKELWIVDEVSTVPDTHKRQLLALAEQYDARIVFIGDPAQIQTVNVGTGLRLMTQEVEPLCLTTVRRFESAWEGPGSIDLRDRKESAIDLYDSHGRILGGTREDMIERFLAQIVADELDGRDALGMVASTDLASELNSHVRQQRIELGVVDGSQRVKLHDDNYASPGDFVAARQTERELIEGDPDSEISNRQTFHLESLNKDGSAMVRPRIGREDDGTVIYGKLRLLPAEYVRNHLELAYVTTAHSRIGRTVERAYVLVTDSMDWHVFYTAMTRGMQWSVAFVPLKHKDDEPVETATEVIMAMAEKPDTDLSMTEELRAELDSVTHLATLGPIHDDLQLVLAHDRHESVINRVLPAYLAEAIDKDEAKNALYRLMFVVEREGHDLQAIVERAVSMREWDTADSVAQVLHWRIEVLVGAPEPVDFTPTRYVDGVPKGTTPYHLHLLAIAEVMDKRMTHLADRCVESPPIWAQQHLGPIPADPLERTEWAERAAAIEAHRERYTTDMDDPTVIGQAPGRKAVEERASWERAYAALGRPAEQDDVARLNDGQLLLRIRRWELKERWLPTDVSQTLKATTIAARRYEAEAVHSRERDDTRAAQGAQRLSNACWATVHKLETIAAVRLDAERATEPERRIADHAHVEFCRRHETTNGTPLEDVDHEGVPLEIDEALERAERFTRDQEQAEHAMTYDHFAVDPVGTTLEV